MASIDPPSTIYSSMHDDNSGQSSPCVSGGDYSQVLENEEGWDLQFVPRRSEKYDCPICLLVLREPMQTECGHRFCKACILKWLRESDTRCPVDNQPLEETQLFSDNFAKREILALTVKCPNHKKGCDQVVVLKHLQNHLNVCVYSFTPCPNECSDVLLRGDLSSHLLTQCPKRMVKCSLCQADVMAEKLKDHEFYCPLGVINCRSCDVRLTRQQLHSHIQSECQKTVTRCQYHFLGCKFEEERRLIPEHENSSQLEHMSLLNRALILLFSVLNINPSVNTTVQRPSSLGYQPTELSIPSDGSRSGGVSGAASYPSYFVDGSNRQGQLSLIQHIFNNLNLNPETMSVNPSSSLNISPGSSMGRSNSLPVTPEVPTIVEPHQLTQQKVEERLEVECTSGSADQNRTNSNGTCVAELSYTSKPSSRQDNEVPQLSIHENQLRSFKSQNELQDESLARHDQKLLNLEQQNEYQDKLIRDLKMKIKSLESMVTEFEGRSGNGIYIWKIKNYFKMRREAEKGETTAIHSQSFYSSFYGYKLCIRVNLNGVDSAKGTHLSLFIHFMQGEYDELLEWPFNGQIILTVIDQNPICEMRNHISETLMSKPNLAAFQRPVSSRNHKGFGYMEFLPLNVIDGSTYVRNDTLIIKARIIANNA